MNGEADDGPASGLGHPVSAQQAYLAVETFFEWFHQDIFVYHSSQIGEFLNNIRWALRVSPDGVSTVVAYPGDIDRRVAVVQLPRADFDCRAGGCCNVLGRDEPFSVAALCASVRDPEVHERTLLITGTSGAVRERGSV